ncbi:MAG: alpha-amylase family glycosyl hydrolase [Treponema sp.]|nr:alpha-amylase family glycosyl hydrolase [Treponema sp.]
MKKLGIKRLLLALSAFAVLLAGCSNSLDERSEQEGSGAFGSVSINDAGRAIFADDISYAIATVSGTGIESGSEPIGRSNVSGGAGKLAVEKIPAGKNRIITVQAFSSSNGKLNGVTLRAICDVKADTTNSVTVNWASTALGNVFDSLLSSGKNLSDVSSDDIVKIKAAIPTDVSAPFVNAAKIASDYATGGGSGLKSSSEYKLSAATVTLSTKNISGYKVYVGDPSSGIQTISAETSERTLQVAPGTWPIYVVDTTGAVKGFAYGTFSRGGTHTINITNNDSVKIVVDGTVIDDRIIVHAKYKAIYIWETGNSSLDKKSYEMIEESSGWYKYEIPTTKSNIIFKNSIDSWDGQTANLSRTAGEWWYKDGKWYDGNPEDSVAPVISLFTSSVSGTVTGTVTLSAKVTDNSALKKVVFSIEGTNGKEIGTAEISGTSATATCEWNTAYVKNGTYTIKAVAYDTANNASEAKTLSLTTKNENLPPIAVISGSSYAKIDSTKEFNAENSYDQNGGTIKSYSWSVSGGATISTGSGTSKITVKMPSSAGEVTISLSVTDDENASSATVTKTVKVREQTQTSGDFRDETIYFLMTTRFYDGDTGNNLYCWDEGGEYLPYGSGADCSWRGDFKGLIEKLDYIKALGFSAIWITPVVVNASGIDYHGYHAFDFSHVDPRYASGSPKYDMNGDDISGDEAYQELIDAVHSKGMKIIQDIVLNHSGNWGEKNLYPMFTKGDIYTSDGYRRSPNMVANEKFENLKNAEKKKGFSDYNAAISAKQEYAVRLACLKDDDVDTGSIYHHEGSCEYKDITMQMGSMAGDCVDLNTENPTVQKYLIDCYTKYIDMGVDGFRIDTTKHISRLIFNRVFNPAFIAAAKANGNDNFFMTGEVCARWNQRWSDNDIAQGSPSFYTWKDTTEDGYDISTGWTVAEINTKQTPVYKFWDDHINTKWIAELSKIQPKICNALLSGNSYHSVDTTYLSGLNTIDFKMHWQFKDTNAAFNAALSYDTDIWDATWNVVYVDSHDYAPDQSPEDQRFTGYWPDKLNLIFTFRGIPCIYYGSEVEFQKGMPIDPANKRTSLDKSGRAYFGDYLEGTVTATDFGEYTASGTVKDTLNHDLAQHIIRLNQIRRAIPALRKGQYSTEGCSGSIAFKRRYTDNDVDSFAAVAINGGATFTGLPSGTYIEVVTGKTINSNGTITTDSIGDGNMRVYVLKTDSCEVDGKIGKDGAYLK